ncbi:hypothetical protein EHH60_08195 [Bradyrhizobium sp. RP6]|nr:hypothetical protein EHH60_08195 [Bradyrhizobium sp. RP6]
MGLLLPPHHCEELLPRSNPDCSRGGILDCFAEPVIGPRSARTRWLAMMEFDATACPTPASAWPLRPSCRSAHQRSTRPDRRSGPWS